LVLPPLQVVVVVLVVVVVVTMTMMSLTCFADAAVTSLAQ
jgi:hypothetical protein